MAKKMIRKKFQMWRKARGFSFEKLARLLDCSYGTLFCLENCKVASPSFALISQLAKIIGTDSINSMEEILRPEEIEEGDDQ